MSLGLVLLKEVLSLSSECLLGGENSYAAGLSVLMLYFRWKWSIGIFYDYTEDSRYYVIARERATTG